MYCRKSQNYSLSIRESYNKALRIFNSLIEASHEAKGQQEKWTESFNLLKQLRQCQESIKKPTHTMTTSYRKLHSNLMEIKSKLDDDNQIFSIENILLLLEQCSPSLKHCIITNELIPIDKNTPSFIFINGCCISEYGMKILLKRRQTFEDSDKGLRSLLTEISHKEQKKNVTDISDRDIIRLRLYIEKSVFLAPTFVGLVSGFILGGLSAGFILSVTTFSLTPLICFAMCLPFLGALLGNSLEKEWAKNKLKEIIGPLPVYTSGQSLYELLQNEKKPTQSWCCLFNCLSCFDEGPHRMAESPRMIKL